MTLLLRRKVKKAIAYGAIGLAALVAVVVLGAILLVQGPLLAKIVNGVLPEQRGKMHFGAIRWKARLFYDLVADRSTPMIVEGLTITDPEGTVVLDVPHLEVAVRLKALLTGGGIILSDLKVGPASIWRFSKMEKHPGIGFLAAFDSKRPTPPPPPPRPGAKKEKGFVFQIVNAELNGFRAIFDFPGAWGLDLRDIHTPASVLVDGEGFVGWDVPHLEARQGGYLKILTETLPFDSVLVERVATTRDWPDDIFLDLTAGKTGRTKLSGKGFFTGIYGENSVSGIKLRAEFEHAVDALSAVAKPHALPGLHLAGENAKVVADLRGPYESMKIEAAVSGLDVAYDSYQASQLAVRAIVAFATTDPTLTLKLDELSFFSPSGGKFSTSLTMTGDDIQAKLAFSAFGSAAYLPKHLRTLAAGRLSGGMEIAANTGAKKSLRLHGLDLRFERTFGKSAIPQSVHVTGQAEASPDVVHTTGLHIDVPGATADIRGKVELAKRLVDVGLRVGTSNLPQVLSKAHVPPVAQSIAVAVDVTGKMDSPQAHGRIDVNGIGGGTTGLPSVDRLATNFQFHDGTLTVDSLLAKVAGGRLEGSGTVKLFDKSISHMLAAPTFDFRLEGKHISLQELVTTGLVKGLVSFQVSATGTTKRPRVHLQVPTGTTVEVLGQRWSVEGLDIEADKESIMVRLCHVTGKTGGDLRLEGHVGMAQRPWPMEWHLQIVALPIAGLLAAAKVDVPTEGNITLDLNVAGTTEVPRINGTISLAKVRAFGINLGAANLDLAPTSEGGLAISGTLFDRLKIDASGSLGPKGVEATALLTFEHLRLEEIIPDLQKQGIAAALTGGIRLRLEPAKSPALTIDISEIDASLTRRVALADGGASNEKLWLKNASKLHVETDGESVVLDPIRLTTQGGEFTLSGQVHPIRDSKGEAVDRAVEAAVVGHLDLEFLQPFVASKLTSLHGAIALEVHAAGSVAHPVLHGQIGIVRPLRAEAIAFDKPVSIPSGTIHLASSSIDLTDLAVTIADSTLRLGGKVILGPGFVPTGIALQADGDVNAALLESIAPTTFSDVTGKASIHASVAGTLEDPNIAASINLGEIQMRLRGINGLLTVQSGAVKLTSHELLLQNVRVRINEEGELLIGATAGRPGRVGIRSLRPEFQWDSLDLPLRGNRLAYRDAGIEVNDLSFAMELTGDPKHGLSLDGDVRLISGRYVQDFNVSNLVLSPRINESGTRSEGKAEPLLQNLALNLRVRTEGDGFVVQNNLANEIHILVDLSIGGTLSSPTLGGEIRPTDGRFHILGLRGDFELSPNVNHVTFVPTKSLAAGDTPELNLEAQNTYPDASGTEHLVLMRISGPINQATIDLSTADGMDRNQTMLLLLSGRTTDDLSGNGGQIFGMNQRSGLDMIGQVSRDAVSNLVVDPYINDTLQMLTGHKWTLRPTVGADGIEVKVGAQAAREFNFELSYLLGYQNQQRYRARFSEWVRDYLTLQMIGDRLTYSLQQGIPVQTNTFRLELTLEYPIRIPAFLIHD